MAFAIGLPLGNGMKHAALPILAVLLGACGSGTAPQDDTVEVVEAEATPTRKVSDETWAIHNAAIVMDSHLDTPAVLERPGFDIMERHDAFADYSQVDLPRMIDGGLDGGFWVIYTAQGPVTEIGFQTARDTALIRAMTIQRMLAAYPEHFEIALKAEDAARIEAQGKRIVYQSIENAYPLGEDISLLSTFYDFGVRMVGPVHFLNNQFGDSATDLAGPKWGGLSPLGEELVVEANRLGIILDASHAHDLTFDDMVELSATPIILSHSGAKDVFDHPRNIDDERLLKLAESGGVIQMNALGAYLKALQTEPLRRQAYGELFEEYGRDVRALSEDRYNEFLEKRRVIDAKFPSEMADFEDYMDHFIHVLDLIGAEHVGVGADWDGGGGVLGMEDISAFPLITERLLEEGYTEEDIKLIWGGNMLRLLAAAEAHAASLKSPPTTEPD